MEQKKTHHSRIAETEKAMTELTNRMESVEYAMAAIQRRLYQLQSAIFQIRLQRHIETRNTTKANDPTRNDTANRGSDRHR